MRRRRREARQLDLFAETGRQPMPCSENIVSAWRRFDPARKADTGTIVLQMDPTDAWFYVPVRLEIPKGWSAVADVDEALVQNEHQAVYRVDACIEGGWIRVVG